MKRGHFRLISLAFSLLGIFWIVSSQTNITGAAIGSSLLSSSFLMWFGIGLIVLSVILFILAEKLEYIMGYYNYEDDPDYQGLKKQLEKKGKRIDPHEPSELIDFETYRDFLVTYKFNQLKKDKRGAYVADKEEFDEIMKHSQSDANRYINSRIKDLKKDDRRVADITRILHNEGKTYNEADVKKKRDDLLQDYRDKNIDETEFADRLSEEGGELTGGVYNPGHGHLSVKVMDHPLKIPDEGNNSVLARALHARILGNSPAYKKDCEFHYSKTASTKHHTGGLP